MLKLHLQALTSNWISGGLRLLETIDFKKLPGELAAAAEFLRDHVKGPVKTKGDQIQLDDVNHKDLKLLVHKFLRHRGLDTYRVLSRQGTIEIVSTHPVEHSKHVGGGGSVPPAAATMPYFFPGTPGPIPIEKKRSKRHET